MNDDSVMCDNGASIKHKEGLSHKYIEILSQDRVCASILVKNAPTGRIFD